MRIKTTLGAVITGTLLSAPLAFTQDHLVTTDIVQSRVAEAAARRLTNLATVDAALSSPEAVAAAATLRVDLGPTRAHLGTLSDSELQELAARVSALQSDPVAGEMTRRQMYWIAAVAAAVILVIIIA